MPSFWSSVVNCDWKTRRSQRMPSVRPISKERFQRSITLVTDPTIILADEPTGSLDDDSANIIIDLLNGVHIRGTTVIVATHDKDLIKKTGGRVLLLKQGRLEGSTFAEKHYDNSIF